MSENEEKTSGTSDKGIILMSYKEVFNIETDEEDNAKNSLSDRVETLLKVGRMPLFLPGRRQKTGERLQVSVKPTPMFSPPRAWRKLTADQKLTAWRFEAMTLAKEHRADTVKERRVLYKYAMLAWSCTAVPRIIYSY